MNASNPHDQVVLVDAFDEAIGKADKHEAHVAPGQLHRALSGFVFDGDGRLILQRRAEAKSHFALKWANSFCTHPFPDETVIAAAQRRVRQELGITCALTEVGVFTYRAADPQSGLVEHEVDHVLIGRSDQVLDPDPDEVAEVAAHTIAELQAALERDPQRFAPWLAPALAVVINHLASDQQTTEPFFAGRSTPE